MITPKLNASWDLELDTSGNLKMLEGVNAQAQGIANKVKLFTGEAVYNLAAGQPWFADTLAHRPPPQLVAAHLEEAALQVEGVATAKATILGLENRVLSARIEFTTDNGESGNVTI